MKTSLEIYITLIVVGLLLIGVEIFLPGGVIGALGALCFVAAIAAGFFAFGPQGGLVSAMILIVAGVISMIVWIRLFPGTRLGRRLSLQRSGEDFKAPGDVPVVAVGAEGVARSSLRPAGIAEIDGQRRDVVAEAGYIAAGARVRVILVEGPRIVVRAMETE
jgi:membrane-bound serine protease (ClpP class)